jgi:hypothetical protein
LKRQSKRKSAKSKEKTLDASILELLTERQDSLSDSMLELTNLFKVVVGTQNRLVVDVDSLKYSHAESIKVIPLAMDVLYYR